MMVNQYKKIKESNRNRKTRTDEKFMIKIRKKVKYVIILPTNGAQEERIHWTLILEHLSFPMAQGSSVQFIQRKCNPRMCLLDLASKIFT